MHQEPLLNATAVRLGAGPLRARLDASTVLQGLGRQVDRRLAQPAVPAAGLQQQEQRHQALV